MHMYIDFASYKTNRLSNRLSSHSLTSITHSSSGMSKLRDCKREWSTNIQINKPLHHSPICPLVTLICLQVTAVYTYTH